MNYYRVGGDWPRYRTGTPTNTADVLREGFDRHMSESLDAPEAIPMGGMHTIEWDSHLEPVRFWFSAQIINLRSYL